MVNLVRKVQKIFGGNFMGNPSQVSIAKFGSKANGAAAYSDDPDQIQTAEFLAAWNGAVIIDGQKKIPQQQDFNALGFVLSYQLAYLFQKGIPEYNSATEYYASDIVRESGTTNLYSSLTNSNIGNPLNGTNWQLLGDLANLANIGIKATKNVFGNSLLKEKPVEIRNNATTPQTHMDFLPGHVVFKGGSGEAFLGSTLTKNADAAWALGSNAGGRAAGVTLTPDTNYYCFILSSADGSLVDAGYDSDINAANLLATPAVQSANLTKYQRRGAFRSNTAGDGIRAGEYIYFKDGHCSFEYNSYIRDRIQSPIPTSPTNLPLSVPPNFISRSNVALDENGSGTTPRILYCRNNRANLTPSATDYTFYLQTPGGSLQSNTAPDCRVKVDSSSQINICVDAGAFDMEVLTIGWIDKLND